MMHLTVVPLIALKPERHEQMKVPPFLRMHLGFR